MNNPNHTCKTAQQCYTPSTLTTEQAFQRYEDIRDRLPKADFPENSILTHSLQGVANHVDAFVLDAFGVLNVGQTPIPDAVNRMAELRATGKKTSCTDQWCQRPTHVSDQKIPQTWI